MAVPVDLHSPARSNMNCTSSVTQVIEAKSGRSDGWKIVVLVMNHFRASNFFSFKIVLSRRDV